MLWGKADAIEKKYNMNKPYTSEIPPHPYN